MLIVIVGCGRMGSLVASTISRHGESVIIIDSDENSFNSLSTDFSGFKIAGDASQVEILKRAKTDQANLLMVLTGDDNINLMIAEIGKSFFKIKNTIARVFDPNREEIFHRLGIVTICPIRTSVSSLIETIKKYQKEQ